MMAKFECTRTGLFLLIALVLCNLTSAKQLIRLRNGLECPETGYFRDAENCRKFYYCPSASAFKREDDTPLTVAELQLIREFISRGVECPEGTIFVEAEASCQSILLVNSIPPECKLPKIVHTESKMEIENEISDNVFL